MRDPRRQNRAARRRARRLGRSLAPRKGVLAVLSASAALLLPGLAKAQEERWTIDYGYSHYSEDPVDKSKVEVGSPDRYEIDTHQIALKGPITGRMDVGLNVVTETMTGSSPWYIEPDANNKPVVVMTGASISDARTDVSGHGTYYFDTSRLNLQGGYSTEDDYQSMSFGLGSEHDFNEKNTTLSWGAGMSFDTIDPTPTTANPNPDTHDKRSISLFAGWSQVLGRSSALQTAFSYTNGSGFLSDPYKLVSIGGVNVADNRPDQRNQYALLLRYRRFFESVTGTLHLDYRYYYDDWKLSSHTVELAWYQSLFDVVTVTPSVRYYTQSQADFYGPYFSSVPGDYASSDYRLSPYGALSGKVRLEMHIADWPFHMAWKLGGSYERYYSSGAFAIQHVGLENPALVNFNVFMIDISARF